MRGMKDMRIPRCTWRRSRANVTMAEMRHNQNDKLIVVNDQLNSLSRIGGSCLPVLTKAV